MLRNGIRTKLLLCFLLTFITHNVSSSDKPKIADLSVFGVMLGDNADQVIKGMTEYFSISQDDLSFTKNFSQNRISSVKYSFDQHEVAVYLWAEDSAGKLIGLTSSIVFDWQGDSEYGDNLSAKLSEFSPPSIARDYGGGNFQRTWCDTLNAAKDKCASKSGEARLRRLNGSGSFGMGWNQ